MKLKSHRLHWFDLSPLCAFKCLIKSHAWIHISCIWFFSTMCCQMCPHRENILTSKGRGRRSWPTIKSPFTLYKQVPKNPGISFSKIPGFLPTENHGIPGIPPGPGGDGDDQWSRWLWQIFIRKIQRQKQVSSNFLIPCQELFSRWFISSSLFHP